MEKKGASISVIIVYHLAFVNIQISRLKLPNRKSVKSSSQDCFIHTTGV